MGVIANQSVRLDVKSTLSRTYCEFIGLASRAHRSRRKTPYEVKDDVGVGPMQICACLFREDDGL